VYCILQETWESKEWLLKPALLSFIIEELFFSNEPFVSNEPFSKEGKKEKTHLPKRGNGTTLPKSSF
jgi:hypothetical protein